MNKELIRKKILCQRQQLDLNEVTVKSGIIYSKIIRSDYYQMSKQIFLYASAKGEVDTRMLIKQSLLDHKTVALPKVFRDGNMKFFSISTMNGLVINSFGIFEPSGLEEEILPTNKTLFIVPLIAFDQQLNRIGYGKGYYDTYLASNEYLATVGIAYELQCIDNFEQDHWDIRLSQVITEYNTYQ